MDSAPATPISPSPSLRQRMIRSLAFAVKTIYQGLKRTSIQACPFEQAALTFCLHDLVRGYSLTILSEPCKLLKLLAQQENTRPDYSKEPFFEPSI